MYYNIIPETVINDTRLRIRLNLVVREGGDNGARYTKGFSPLPA